MQWVFFICRRLIFDQASYLLFKVVDIIRLCQNVCIENISHFGIWFNQLEFLIHIATINTKNNHLTRLFKLDIEGMEPNKGYPQKGQKKCRMCGIKTVRCC